MFGERSRIGWPLAFNNAIDSWQPADDFQVYRVGLCAVSILGVVSLRFPATPSWRQAPRDAVQARTSGSIGKAQPWRTDGASSTVVRPLPIQTWPPSMLHWRSMVRSTRSASAWSPGPVDIEHPQVTQTPQPRAVLLAPGSRPAGPIVEHHLAVASSWPGQHSSVHLDPALDLAAQTQVREVNLPCMPAHRPLVKASPGSANRQKAGSGAVVAFFFVLGGKKAVVVGVGRV